MKQEILDWFCAQDKCNQNKMKLPCKKHYCGIDELSDMLDQYRAEIVGSVPCERSLLVSHDLGIGWNDHCAEVEEWKQKQQEGG